MDDRPIGPVIAFSGAGGSDLCFAAEVLASGHKEWKAR
jgi:hypothetical protein